MEKEAIKQIIQEELPSLIQDDIQFRNWIIDISKVRFVDKWENETRFDKLLGELRNDREEQNHKWKEQNHKWEENQKEIRSLVESVKQLSDKHDSTIGALGARWGIRTEASFRNGLKGILEDHFNIEVINVIEYDDEGGVFGRPEQIELDIIIKNGLLIVAEIKSSFSKGDMYIFYKKAKFYEKKHKKKISKMMIISPMVDKKAAHVAESLGIDVYSYADTVVL